MQRITHPLDQTTRTGEFGLSRDVIPVRIDAELLAPFGGVFRRNGSKGRFIAAVKLNKARVVNSAFV